MKKLVLATILSIAAVGHAQDDSTTMSKLQFSKEGAETAPAGLLPFIGIAGGYTGYGGSGDGSTEGTPGTLKLLGSYYFQNSVITDFGYGFNSQSFIQKNAKDASINNSAFELAVRYGFENKWQAGVIADQLANQGKNYGAEQADAQFVGLQVLKETSIAKSWLSRIGARAMALTNNKGNDVYMYLIDLQFGWNPQAYKTTVKSTAEALPPKKQEQIVTMSETPVTTQREVVLRDIAYSSIASAGTIKFASAKMTVSKKDRIHLTKLAKAINSHKDLLERIEVVGYADSSGKTNTNQKISLARAEKVKTLLEKSGLKEVPITAVGRGDQAASNITLKGDRRAELIFIGVKDETALKNVLASIQ